MAGETHPSHPTHGQCVSCRPIPPLGAEADRPKVRRSRRPSVRVREVAGQPDQGFQKVSMEIPSGLSPTGVPRDVMITTRMPMVLSLPWNGTAEIMREDSSRSPSASQRASWVGGCGESLALHQPASLLASQSVVCLRRGGRRTRHIMGFPSITTLTVHKTQDKCPSPHA